MIKHLRLFLERHRYLWAIQKLHELLLRADAIRSRIDRDHEAYVPLLETLADLEAQITSYNDELFGAAPAAT